MSWRMKVRHTTTYQYSARCTRPYNEARISPLDTPNQFTLEHRVEVHPAANLFRYRDYWGSRVHVVRPAPRAHRAHRDRLVAGGDGGAHAEPRRHGGVGRHRRARADRPVLRVPRRHHHDRVRRRDPAGGARSSGRRRRPAAALSRLGEWLRAHVEYETGTTSVSTTAAEVLRAGRGVCQDFAHLGIAVLRAAGIPARYASGYLYPDELGGVVGETHQGESHAWLEAWVGDWHPLDPTSGSPRRRAPRARRARPRLRRRRAAQGRVPRRSEPLTRRHGGADPRRVGDEAEPCPEGGTVERNRPSGSRRR